MKSQIHSAAAKGYAVGADAYERGRPEYPATAVERLVIELKLDPQKIIVDLGAGTGKFTKLLSAHTDAKIMAVEPVEAMRKKFASNLPSIEILDGSAENFPLPINSVDAVVVAQAFHWFDGERALQEIHRALKPGGWLGLIWNVRDESKEWVASLTNIIDPHEAGAPRYKSGKWRDAFRSTKLFSELSSADFYHFHCGSPETVVDRVASISFISALPEGARNKVLSEVRALMNESPETKGKDQIEFPYRTDIFWCQKLLC